MPERKHVPKHKRPQNTFTATEVGTLLESIQTEIRLVADGVADIQRQVDGLKAWRTDVMNEVEGLKLWRVKVTGDLNEIMGDLRTIKANLKTFEARIQAVEAKVAL
jgi:hypothetical protein